MINAVAAVDEQLRVHVQVLSSQVRQKPVTSRHLFLSILSIPHHSHYVPGMFLSKWMIDFRITGNFKKVKSAPQYLQKTNYKSQINDHLWKFGFIVEFIIQQLAIILKIFQGKLLITNNKIL